MQKPILFLNPHRRARLIALALALLAWIAAVLCAQREPNQRHLRQRARHLSLVPLTRFVCGLAIMRAVQIAGARLRTRQRRNATPRGLRQRRQARALRRAVIGARLRKALRRGDIAARVQFLITALADIEAFARRYFLARARRRLNKLYAIVAATPPAAAIPAAPTFAPACADSS